MEFVAREWCDRCNGSGMIKAAVPIPQFPRPMLVDRFIPGTLQTFKDIAWMPTGPTTHFKCYKCGGKGYFEKFVTLEQLADLLKAVDNESQL